MWLRNRTDSPSNQNRCGKELRIPDARVKAASSKCTQVSHDIIRYNVLVSLLGSL